MNQKTTATAGASRSGGQHPEAERTTITMKHETLLAALDNLLGAATDQKATEAETLSPELCQAMRDAIEAWTGRPVPEYLRNTEHAFQDFAAEWETLPRSPKGIPSAPEFGSPFWKAFNKLQQEFKTAEEKRPKDFTEEPEEQADTRTVEPISVLIAQHLTPTQICKLYRAPWVPGETDGPGLWDNNRKTPMLARYHKEVKEPGSVLGANYDEFPDYDCHEQAQRLQRQRELCERIKAAADARRARQIAELASRKQNTSDQADLAELVSQGVGGIQIGTILHIPVEEVERQCREQGIPVPPRRYSPALEVSRDLPDDVRESRERIGKSMFSAFQDRGSQRQAERTTATATTATDDADDPADFGGSPSDDGQDDGD